uniref:Nucleocapsid protein n=1 Tax=Hemipteran rhabdo-related virus OKIAV26 TaxID=2746290 RepID=A0A7D7FM15_9RHAB|nr:nucleocapsid protein [Hemipteran rhabdo-related virus OKIAV26]
MMMQDEKNRKSNDKSSQFPSFWQLLIIMTSNRYGIASGEYTNETLLDLLNETEETDFKSISLGAPSTPWNDTDFQKILTPAQLKIRSACEVNIAFKNALKYLAIYLGAETVTKANHKKLMWDVISATTVKEEYLFPGGSVNTGSWTTDVQEITNYKFPGDITSISDGTRTIGISDVKTFYENAVNASSSTPDEKREYINVAGFLALTLLRTPFKGFENLGTHLISAATQSFTSLFSPSEMIILLPPHASYTRLYETHFPQHDPDYQHLVAICVHAWHYNSTSTHIQVDHVGVLQASCLLSLSENGLGLLSWSCKAAKSFGIPTKQYLEHLCLTPALTSQVVRASRFVKMMRDEYSWPWCRIFKSTSHSNMSTAQNPEACIIGAIFTLDDPTTIYEMAQFSTCRNLINAMFPVAGAIQEIILQIEARDLVVGASQKVAGVMHRHQDLTAETFIKTAPRHVRGGTRGGRGRGGVMMRQPSKVARVQEEEEEEEGEHADMDDYL